MTLPPDTRTIDAGALTVGYIESGSGIPLFLIHGGESDRTQFAALRPYLGPGIRAISYDQRDSGVTVNPPAPFTASDLADDVVALMDALGIDTAFVLGTSYGGVVTQHVALRHPSRIDGIALVGTTPSMTIRTAAAERLMELAPEDRHEVMIDLLLSPEGRAKNSALAQRGRSVLATRTPEQQARRMAVMASHHVTDRLGDIEVPTLVIHGTDDQLTPPEGARILASGIPDARLRWIDSGRHGIATEFPDQIAALVREFVGLPPYTPTKDDNR